MRAIAIATYPARNAAPTTATTSRRPRSTGRRGTGAPATARSARLDSSGRGASEGVVTGVSPVTAQGVTDNDATVRAVSATMPSALTVTTATNTRPRMYFATAMETGNAASSRRGRGPKLTDAHAIRTVASVNSATGRGGRQRSTNRTPTTPSSAPTATAGMLRPPGASDGAGPMRASPTRRTAVRPTSRWSRHKVRSASNQRIRLPVRTQSETKKAAAPTGASAGAIHERRSPRRRVAITAALMQASTMGAALGRVAVATAAAKPATIQRRSYRASRHVAHARMSNPSAYAIDSTKAPGKTQKSVTARSATLWPASRRARNHTASAAPAPITVLRIIAMINGDTWSGAENRRTSIGNSGKKGALAGPRGGDPSSR